MLFAIDDLARRGWMIVLRGLAVVLFGILALVWPGLMLGALVLLYGPMRWSTGAGHNRSVLRRNAASHHYGARQSRSVLAGVIAFAYPGLTALVLLYIIAAWA